MTVRAGLTTTSKWPVRGYAASVRPPALSGKPSRRCGEKRFCKEMSSCEEVRYYLNECGVKGLDGDSDGRPCESVCAR